MGKILVVAVVAVLLGLNLFAIALGVNDDGIAGCAAIAIGVALLAIQFRRGRDFGGRLGCISWMLPIVGVWFILQGAYAGLLAVTSVIPQFTQPLRPTARVAVVRVTATRPRSTPVKAAAPPTAESSGSRGECLPVGEVSLGQEGQTICVYGVVLDIGQDGVAQYINFRDAKFQLVTYNLDLALSYLAGACIQQRGTVARLINRPVIFFDAYDSYTSCDAPPPESPKSTATPRPSTGGQVTQPTRAPSGQGTLHIVNEGAFGTRISLWGPAEKTIDVAPGQSITVDLPAGEYGWTSFSNGCQLRPTNNLRVNPAATIRIIPDEGPCGSRLTFGGGAAPNPNPATSQCPNGCVQRVPGCDIKGNVSFDSGERIYHVPGGEFYDATTINPNYGERWFCSEAEAVANGWRKSQR